MVRALKIAINHTRFQRHGGIEGYIHAWVRRLLASGHEVHLHVRRWEPLEHPRLRFRPVRVLPLGEGIKVLSFARASERALRGERYDVIHSFTKTWFQTLYTDGSGCFDDYDVFLRSESLWRRMTKLRPLLWWAFRLIEAKRFNSPEPPHVLAMSRQIRAQVLSRYRIPPERVSVLYPGVDTVRFRPLTAGEEGAREALRARWATGPGQTAALFVGRDFRRKGLAPALEAAARLRSEGLILWIAGDDTQRWRFEALGRRLGAETRYLGSVEDPCEHFRAADLFLLPSHFDAFANVGLEALASGLPCILSSRAGVSELVEDGRDGLVLQDPASADELTGHLRTLLDPRTRSLLGGRARATALAHDLGAHFDQLESLYGRLAAGAAPW